MSRFRIALTCLMVAGFALSAHADTTYTATAKFGGTDKIPASNGGFFQNDVTGTMSGTAEISDAGVIDSLNLTLTFDDGYTFIINPSTYAPERGSKIDEGQIPSVSFSGMTLPSEDQDVFFFNIVTPPDGIYDGGAICSTTLCGSISTTTFFVESGAGYTGTYTLRSGTLVAAPAVAATPEPSSLALLGTGLLGVVGTARRRFSRA